jgi:dienelactone hydrolase
MKLLSKLLFLAAVFVGLSFGSSAIAASETVNFSAPDVQPTPFKLKRAAAKGITLEPTPGMAFTGAMTMPEGAGPHPAVVILISGGGHLASHTQWAETLASWGYASLLVNSFAARGGTSLQDTSAVDMSTDAFAAFLYLAGRDDVDASKIGLMGFSAGASFAFAAMREVNKLRPDGVDFAASVSFYPTCDVGYEYAKPTLILFGGQDILTSLSQCEKLVEENVSHGSVELHVYPDATHFFDSTDYSKDAGLHGSGWTTPFAYEQHTYDEAAHTDSVARTKTFLDGHLK